MEKKYKESSASIEIIKQKIFIIRGHKVMMSNDLAEIYQVKVRRGQSPLEGHVMLGHRCHLS